MLRRIWNWVVSLLTEPVPKDLVGRLEADADREATKEQWAADEGRQTRRIIG
jgi:hypothetical protein